MSIKLRSSVKFLYLKDCPVRINIIVVRSLPKRSINAYDKHTVVHRFLRIIMEQTLPSTVLKSSKTECCKEHSPMMIKFIESMIAIRETSYRVVVLLSSINCILSLHKIGMSLLFRSSILACRLCSNFIEIIISHCLFLLFNFILYLY